MGGRQEAQKQYLERELSEGLLCAVINNNTRCYNESTEFADHLDDALAGPYKVRPSRHFIIPRHISCQPHCQAGVGAVLPDPAALWKVL